MAYYEVQFMDVKDESWAPVRRFDVIAGILVAVFNSEETLTLFQAEDRLIKLAKKHPTISFRIAQAKPQ